MIALVAVQNILIGNSFARVASSDNVNVSVLLAQLTSERELLQRYGFVLILLVIAMFVGLMLMLIRARRTEEKASAELEQKIQERTGQLESERNLMRTLIDHMPAEFYIKDTQGRFLDANAMVARNLNLESAAALVGKSDLDFDAKAQHAHELELQVIRTGKALLNQETVNVEHTRWRLENKLPLRDSQGQIVGLVGLNWFITERKEFENALQRRADEFAALYEISRDLTLEGNLSSLLETIVTRARGLLKTTWGDLGLYDARKGDLEFVVAQSDRAGVGTRRALGVGVMGIVAQTRQPLYVNDYQTWEHRVPQLAEMGVRSVLSVPMLYGGELIGVLSVLEIGASRREFGEADVRLLSLLAAQAASAVHNTRLLDRMQDALTVREQSEAETRARNAELEAIIRISQIFTNTRDTNLALQQVAQEMRQTFHARNCGIAVLNDQGTALEVIADALGQQDEQYAVGIVIPVEENPSSQYVLETGKSLVIPHAQTDPRTKTIHARMRQRGSHCLAIIPMLSDGKVIGTIGLDMTQPDAVYSERDIRLAETIAAQLAGTIEKQRLLERTQAALAQTQAALQQFASARRRLNLQYETAEILASAQTLAQATPRLLETICHDLNWHSGELWEYDARADVLHCVDVWHLKSDALAEFENQNRDKLVSPSEGMMRRVFAEREPISILDVALDPDFNTNAEIARAGIRSVFGFPLLSGTTIIGVGFFFSTTPQLLQFEEAAALTTFGRQVGQFMERKRTEERLRRQNEYLAALHATTINLMGRLQVNDLLQTITQRAASLVGTTHGYIYLHEPGEEEMEMRVGIGIFAQMVGTKSRRRIGATGTVWESGERLVVDDYQTWEGRITKGEGTSQLRSLVSFPLKSGDEFVGVFGLAHSDADKKFDETAIEILTRFAHLASIALDNARLYAAAQLEIQVRKQAEARFKLLFEASPDAILLIDPNKPDWRIVDCNHVACEMNGYTRQELIGQPIDLLTTRQSSPAERTAYLEEIRRVGVLHLESEHRRRDGHVFAIETSTSLLKVGDRELVLGIDRDITERKRAEDALRENRARLASLMNNTDDLMLSIDRDLKVTIFNEPFKNMIEYGMGKQVQAGASVSDFIEPETLAIHLENYERAFAGERCRYEVAFQVAEGKLYFETYLNPIYGADHAVIGLAIFTRDITKRKAAEQALVQQKELLQTVFDNTPVMIGMFDAHGRYTLINHEWEKTLGYTLEEMNESDVMTKLYPDADQRLAARSFMFAPTPGWQDFSTVVHDGHTLDTSWAYKPLSEGMTIAFGQDISQRKRVERLKNEFISTVSHELRTPLTSIRGSLGLIAGGVAGDIPETAKNMIDIAYKNSERLVRLINDILDIEKIESGKMVFYFKPLELVPLVEQTMEANRGYAEQYQVNFVLVDAPSEVCVNADADRLTQVLTNLLSNAVKFSPPGRDVQVRVLPNGTNVRVAVSDQGTGIPEEFQNRIFQKFAQADSSDTRQKAGTGLGLSIVKAIVEKHGGTIGYESVPGSGTTFYFDLPQYHAPAQPEPAAESPKPRILIVEDNQDVALLLNLMLRQGGFETDVSYSAAHALELLRAREYAAVTLDLMLPDRDGISLIRELRAQESTRALPIIVVSAKAEQGKQQLNGDAIWVADWLEKPIDQDQLVRAVEHAARHAPHSKPRILHVEDDPDVLDVVEAILTDAAEITAARDYAGARALLEQDAFDLVILDPALPDGSGTDLLALLHRDSAQIPVVIFSAREEDPNILTQVNAALVKSRTTNEQLLETITRWIDPSSNGYARETAPVAADVVPEIGEGGK